MLKYWISGWEPQWWAGPLGDEGVLCCCIYCRGLELAGESQTHQRGHWGWYNKTEWFGQLVSMSVLPQVNDRLLQERCKGWYPKWQFTFRKFSAIKHFLCNESFPLHREWFMTGFKMYCFDYAYTLWTLQIKIRNLWNKLVNIQNIMLSGGSVM